MINCVKKYFPNAQRISCLFHYKQDILRNLKQYGLYKKDLKDTSMKKLNELGNLPFKYKGNLKYIYDKCNYLSIEYSNHYNFIYNYFLPNKLPFFEDNSLDYFKVPNDCRSNSFFRKL